MLKKISVDKISDLAARLMDKGALVAPVREDAGYNFRRITDAGQVDLGYYNTLMSPKSVFLPQKEDFVTYKSGRPLEEAKCI